MGEPTTSRQHFTRGPATLLYVQYLPYVYYSKHREPLHCPKRPYIHGILGSSREILGRVFRFSVSHPELFPGTKELMPPMYTASLLFPLVCSIVSKNRKAEKCCCKLQAAYISLYFRANHPINGIIHAGSACDGEVPWRREGRRRTGGCVAASGMMGGYMIHKDITAVSCSRPLSASSCVFSLFLVLPARAVLYRAVPSTA